MLTPKQGDTATSPVAGEQVAPPATDDKEPKSLAELVTQVADQHKPAAKATDPSPEAEPAQPSDNEEPAMADQVPDEQTEEEDESKVDPKDEKLPFNNHPRWKEVLKQRNEATALNERNKPLVEMAESLQTYCQTNDISDEDLSAALELAALAKANPTEFRTRIQALVDGIDFASGTRLPADLQKKVDEGIIDQDHAKELAQLRERTKVDKHNSEAAATRARQNGVESIKSALNVWEGSQRKLDPDYEARREDLQDRIKALWVEKPPRTPSEAIALAEEANKVIMARFAKRRPKPRVNKPVPSNGSSTNKGEVHKDLKSLVFAIAEKHRR